MAPAPIPRPETPWERIDRLATELAEALDEWAVGRNSWHLVVPRASIGRSYYMIAERPTHRRDGRVR